MKHFGNGHRPALHPLTYFATTCVLILFTGCGEWFRGESEYEQKARGWQEFTDLVKSVGGTSAENKYFEKYGQTGMAWEIDLSNGRIDDPLIKTMGELDYIIKLNLSNSTITDEQLLELNKTNACQITMLLDLSDTAITDAAFEKLDNFLALQRVKLTGARVTQGAVDRFKKERQTNKKFLLPFRNPEITL